MKKRITLAVVSFFGLGIAATAGGCGVDLTGAQSPNSTFTAASIIDQVPTGIVDGQSWTLVKAEAETDYFDKDRLSLKLYTEDVTTCGFGNSAEKPFLLFSVKKSVGEYPLNFSFGEGGQTVTFVTPPASNTIVSEGIIVIEELTEEKLTMGILAQTSQGEVVNGKFTVDLCASSF